MESQDLGETVHQLYRDQLKICRWFTFSKVGFLKYINTCSQSSPITSHSLQAILKTHKMSFTAKIIQSLSGEYYSKTYVMEKSAENCFVIIPGHFCLQSSLVQ